MTTAGWATIATGLLIVVGVIAAWIAVLRRYPLDDAVGPWRAPDPWPRHVRPRWARHDLLENRISTLRAVRDRESWHQEVDRLHMIGEEAAGRDPTASVPDVGGIPKRFSYPWFDATLSGIERSLQLEPAPADPGASWFVRWRARRGKGPQAAMSKSNGKISEQWVDSSE